MTTTESDFTLDEGYVMAVYRVFAELYSKGWIYRDNYMVNWDPGLGSAISDLEIENREVTDTLYEIAYPLEDGGELIVATVRPETMLADTAVAVSPDDDRYRDVVGKHAILPLVERRLPVIADEHVDPEFGTGALKITPGHDPNDFEIGRKHDLPAISVIGEDGLITDEAPERFRGMTAAEAQEAVVAALRDQGLIRGEEPYTHTVPFSHRSGERIEPLISLQWFCRMDEMARRAIDVVTEGKVRIIPDGARRQYLDSMEKIPPWCISRQLWWGHRLPVWYRGDETHVGETPPEGEGWEQESDVLDTWFSSALWPFATLGWPDTGAPEYRAFFPTDVLVTARDIIALWVARMIMTSLEFTDEVPFSDVYVHSIIQAPDGRRMSKSLGTGIDPLEEMDEHGADALRFGLLAMTSTQDVRFSEARVQQGRDLANKMWNASRLVLMEARDGVEPGPRSNRVEDRWIASRLQRAVGSVTRSIEAYDFAHAALDLYEFFWSELCDWYLEIVKPRLYDGDEDASATLLWALEQVLALAHPMMPFVSEEIYSYLPSRPAEALAVHSFPEADDGLIDDEAEREIGQAIALTRALRRWRDLAGVPVKQVLAARADESSPHELVSRLARVEFSNDGGEPIASVGGVEVLETEGVDPDAVRGPDRGSSRPAPRRGEAGRGQALQRGIRRQGPRRRGRRRAGEARRLSGGARGTGAGRIATRSEEILRKREVLGWKLGLERMRRLCTLLGMPQNRFASIHVVGTNGKTSVTRMTAALLEAHGVSTGAYVSPHITSWRERVLIRGEPISEEAFTDALERTEQSAQVADRSAGDEGPVTQFELLTAAAFVAFAAARVQYAVIEAGLGGRLDATNVIPSQLTVLTSVGYDHTEWLGETLEEIAAEKVAVLRDHTTLIVGRAPGRRSEVSRRERWHGAGTPRTRAGDRVARGAITYQGPQLAPGHRRRSAGRSGELDSDAASSCAATSSGFPGRAELVPGDPPEIFDAAHNPDGARALAEALPELTGGREVICCLAVLEGKDATGIIEGLAPAVSHFVCTEIPPECDRGLWAARRASTAGAGAGGALREGRSGGGGRSPIRSAPGSEHETLPRSGRGSRWRPAATTFSAAYGQRGPLRAPDDDGAGRHRRRGGDPGLLRLRLRVRPSLPLSAQKPPDSQCQAGLHPPIWKYVHSRLPFSHASSTLRNRRRAWPGRQPGRPLPDRRLSGADLLDVPGCAPADRGPGADRLRDGSLGLPLPGDDRLHDPAPAGVPRGP